MIGPQCTGKTTLVLRLLAALSNDDRFASSQPTIIHEVVRGIMKAKHITSDDFGSERWIDLQRCTIEAQADAEESLRERWYISDRSVLDPIVYAQQCKESSNELRKTVGWEASIERMKDGLVILCEAGQRVWLSSDAVRIAFADVQQWEMMNEQFKGLLTEKGISFQILPSHVVSIEERVKLVVAWLLE